MADESGGKRLHFIFTGYNIGRRNKGNVLIDFFYKQFRVGQSGMQRISCRDGG